MNFGKWIVVAFVLFALFIGTLVTVCIRQDIALVSKDYYKEELVYQDQIKRVKNVESLKTKPEVTVQNHTLTITFSKDSKIEHGSLNLFRPSNSRLDRVFELKRGTGHQEFDIEDLSRGMYRAKISWSNGEREFYAEQIIYI